MNVWHQKLIYPMQRVFSQCQLSGSFNFKRGKASAPKIAIFHYLKPQQKIFSFLTHGFNIEPTGFNLEKSKITL